MYLPQACKSKIAIDQSKIQQAIRNIKGDSCSGLAATHEARIQAASADRVLFADPGNESLETESVASVRRGAVPVGFGQLWSAGGGGGAYFRCSVYQ